MIRAAILAALFLLTTSTARGQVEVTGGASSLFNADGGTVFYRTPNTTSFLGVGVANGRLILGAGFEMRRRGCDWFVGDRAITLATGQAGVAIELRGFELSCVSKERTVIFFTGATGRAVTTPYFTGAEPDHFGTGAQITQKFGDLTVTGLASVDGGQHTLLGAMDYHRGNFKADLTAGNIERHDYLAGQASFTSHHFSVAVTRTDYLNLVSATSEGVTVGWGPVTGFASAFQSKASGEAGGISVTAGWLSAQLVTTRSGGKSQTTGNFSERIGPHFSVSQFVSAHNVGLGGSVTGNLLSASVGYQTMFDPTRGFEQVLSVNVRVQLSRGAVAAQLNHLPGRWLYTGYTAIYASGPALAGAQMHMAP